MNIINVLLIEDDIAISNMYVQRFDVEGGFKVVVAHNGLEGLEALKTYKPDIILLDMMMPKMSGLETLQHIRTNSGSKSTKVIALTNMDDPDIVDKIEKLGVSKHIVKANTSPGAILSYVREIVAS